MAFKDRDNRNARNRNLSDCDKERVIPAPCYPKQEPRKWRRKLPCDADGNPCEINTNLTRPSGAVVVVREIIDPQNVGNDPLTLSCEEGTGQDVVIEENEYIVFVEDPSVPGSVEAAKEEANTRAEEAAFSRLVCLFYSVEYTASCEEGSYGEDVVIPEGAFISEVSQEDADNQAIAAANSQLICEYRNLRIEIACDDIEAQLNENNPSVVPAGTYSSTVSQEDAHAQAVNAAEAALVCVFTNDTITRTCANLGYDQGDVINNGNTVIVVPAGSVLSDISKADANAQATVQADTQLVCQYGNDEYTYNCNEGLSPGNYVNAAASIQIKVPANNFFSTESKEDANIQAKAYAEAASLCAWSNDALPAIECDDPNPATLSPLAIQYGGEAVAADRFFSYSSKAEANAIAVAYQNSSLVCLYEDQIGGGGSGDGAPGSQGPAGDCGDSPCAAFYS